MVGVCPPRARRRALGGSYAIANVLTSAWAAAKVTLICVGEQPVERYFGPKLPAGSVVGSAVHSAATNEAPEMVGFDTELLSKSTYVGPRVIAPAGAAITAASRNAAAKRRFTGTCVACAIRDR